MYPTDICNILGAQRRIRQHYSFILVCGHNDEKYKKENGSNLIRK